MATPVQADRVHVLQRLRDLRDWAHFIHDSITMEEATPVVIGDNAWIGTGALILRASVGENSIVAAGAVVTKPVPPNTLVAGNPARVIRSIADPAGA